MHLGSFKWLPRIIRAEKYLTPNKPIGEALENIRKSADLNMDFSFSDDGDIDGCGSGNESNIT